MPQSEFNLRLMEEFRANGGEIVSGRFKGDALLSLTTTGRKSGEPRTTPIGYAMDGDRMYILAMNARRPTLPNWFFNLVANPEVTLEVGTETNQARAVVLDDAEDERLLARFAGREPRLQAALAGMPANALIRLGPQLCIALRAYAGPSPNSPCLPPGSVLTLPRGRLVVLEVHVHGNAL